MRFAILRVVLILFAVQSTGCAAFSLIHRPPQMFQETYSAQTHDKWTLTLHRFYQKGAVKYKNPVILCHGMGYNAYFWDIEKKRSFAKYLASGGFDVWTVSLRGAGRSSKTGWMFFRELLSFRPDDLSNMSLDGNKLNWTIDDHIQQDVPAIIGKVKEITGADQVDWVGHSMGGLIILAYLEHAQNPGEVGSIVTIASGVVHFKPHNAALNFIEKRKLVIDFGLLINQKNMTKAYVLFGGRLKDPFADLFYHRKNVESQTIANLYNYVAENISPGVMNQFILMLRQQYFLSADGKTNYSEELEKVRHPILFVSGRVDNLSDPESVRYGYRKVGSRDKTYLELSAFNGMKMDYGHDDLIIGKYAQKEVYPQIYNWLLMRANPK